MYFVRDAQVLLLLLIMPASQAGYQDALQLPHADLMFSEWRILYSKSYPTHEELNYRERVFNQNKVLVKSLNEKYKGNDVTFKINHFADMTTEEFKSTILMKPSKAPKFPAKAYATGQQLDDDLPDSFDWRDEGVVTTVKDQGSSGTCWAFSAIGNMEGQWAKNGNTLVSLSTELLVDCDAAYDPYNGGTCCGEAGGWPYLGYVFVQELGGIESEQSYPYCVGYGLCSPCPPPGFIAELCGGSTSGTCSWEESCFAKLDESEFISGLEVDSWVVVESDEEVMKQELVRIGPLSVAINAEDLAYYSSGVWDPSNCDPTALDHAILLIGYGVEEETDTPYWSLKNSWGMDWGEQGYFQMVRGTGKCGIDQVVNSAILKQ